MINKSLDQSTHELNFDILIDFFYGIDRIENLLIVKGVYMKFYELKLAK
jgi:hypothetical protein